MRRGAAATAEIAWLLEALWLPVWVIERLWWWLLPWRLVRRVWWQLRWLQWLLLPQLGSVEWTALAMRHRTG